MSNRNELLDRMTQGWAKLNGALAKVSDERLIEGGPDGWWSAKDHLAHVTGWHRILTARLTGEGEHDVLQLALGEYESKDVDGINSQIHERTRDLPIEQVRSDLKESYRSAIEAVETMSDDELERPWLPDHPERGTYTDTIAANTYEHYEEHLPHLEAL